MAQPGGGGAHPLLAEIDIAVELADDQQIDYPCHLRPQRAVREQRRNRHRHRAAAGITSLTDALAIVISEETGGVRIFHHGKIFMEIEKGE